VFEDRGGGMGDGQIAEAIHDWRCNASK
jgi:hypothetical protein